MALLDKPQERFVIEVADASEIARMVGSPGRQIVAREDLEDQLGSGPLILDGLRRRPHYFDGRFLTGADLTRDQDYVRQRQADVARASSAGVISGLQVRSFSLARGQTMRIEAGVGLTPSGDVVMLTQPRDVPLLDLPLTRQLDAAMGLREEPRVPLGRRTGLFILALRAVEFTANPIAAYPRTITGKRTVEDGDIIEATAITLIPYPETSGAATLHEARRAVARQIFTRRPKGLPQDALPLAMLAVERGTVRWVDMAMVRRETGAESGVHVAFGGRPKALAEAHVLQHRGHLADVLAEMQGRGMPPVFAAAQHFATLPAAGQLPAAVVQPDAFGFRQFYFPPTVDVDLAFVPGDEIGALVEESLALPPIDLEAQAADLDATGILILVPVTRQRFQRFDHALGSTATAILADPGAAAAKPAFDLLATLVARRRKLVEGAQRDAEAAAAAEAEALKIKAWHAAFHEAVAALPMESGRPPLFWYIRRRAIAFQSKVAGVAVAVSGDDVVMDAIVNENLGRLKLEKRVAALNGSATPQATARLMALLGSRAIAGSDILTVSVIHDLERVARDDLPRPQLAPVDRFPVADTGPILTREATPTFASSAFVSTNPNVVGRAQPASADFADARAGMERAALAAAAGVTAVARADTPLSLSEGEVLDIAQDYSDPRLGEGLGRLDRALGEAWPDAKGALWLGGTGKALTIDRAFRGVAGEKLGDLAGLLARAVERQESDGIDKVLEQTR